MRYMIGPPSTRRPTPLRNQLLCAAAPLRRQRPNLDLQLLHIVFPLIISSRADPLELEIQGCTPFLFIQPCHPALAAMDIWEGGMRIATLYTVLGLRIRLGGDGLLWNSSMHTCPAAYSSGSRRGTLASSV